MRTIAEILAAMEAAQTEMEGLYNKMQAETDKAKRDGLTALYTAKSQEMDGLKTELATAKTHAETRKMINDAKALVIPVAGNVNPGNPPAAPGNNAGGNIETPSDPAKDYRAKVGFFMDYARQGLRAFVGKERAFDAIAPSDTRFKNIAPDAVLMPTHMVAAILNPDPRFGKALLVTDADVNANSNLSATIAPDFRPQLLKQPVAMPMLYDLCRLLPAVNGKATWPMLDQSSSNFGGVAFTWKAADGADKGETEPKFKDFEIDTHELSGWTEMSLTALSRPAIQLEAELTTLFRDAARYEFSAKILAGTGVNQPTGLLAATSGVTKVTRAAANQINWTDLTNLEYALRQAIRVGGRYLIDDSAEKFLKQTLDGTDRPLYTVDITTNMRTNMAGYPYLAHEYGPTLGNEGDAIFGNLQYYGWAVESDIAIARSDHAEFKKGRVVFRMICFVGGKPIYGNAFSVLDNLVTGA